MELEEKEQEQERLMDEMDELGGPSVNTRDDDLEQKPEDTKQESETEEPKETEQKGPSAETRQMVETLNRLQRDNENIKKALAEERDKRRKLSEMISRQHSADGNDDFQNDEPTIKDHDPEVEKTVREIVSEDINAMRSETRMMKYELSENRAKQRHADFDEITKDIAKEISEKHPALHSSWIMSEDPAETLYQFGIALKFDSIIENAKTKAKEESRKAFLEEYSGRRVISSLSDSGGRTPKEVSDSRTSLMKELDDL